MIAAWDGPSQAAFGCLKNSASPPDIRGWTLSKGPASLDFDRGSWYSQDIKNIFAAEQKIVRR